MGMWLETGEIHTVKGVPYWAKDFFSGSVGHQQRVKGQHISRGFSYVGLNVKVDQASGTF